MPLMFKAEVSLKKNMLKLVTGFIAVGGATGMDGMASIIPLLKILLQRCYPFRVQNVRVVNDFFFLSVIRLPG